MRDSFIFYKSFYEGIKELSDEEKKQVILKIMQYQFDGEQGGNIELSGVSKGLFSLIKQQLDQDNLDYENGKKGGRPRKQKTPLCENENLPFEKEEKEKNQKKKKKEYIYPQGEPPGESKVHFAEFVAMTNAEYEKLCSTYGKEFADQCIEVLDNYKGSKGKKYKDDYRAILSWVVDRVKQNNSFNDKYKSKDQAEVDAFMQKTRKEWKELGEL